MSKAKNGAKSRQQLDRAARFTGRWQLGLDRFSSLLYPIFPAVLPSSICLCHCSLLQQLRIKQRSCMSLQMMHGRPCASRCSPSSTMMQAAQPPKQSHNPLNGRSVPSSEPLAALALHLLLKKRHSRCHSVANTLTRTPSASSSVSSLQTTEVSAERRRRALLDDALDRDQQLDRLNKEMSYWVDMGYTNSNLQYSLLMQNLGELEETTTATTTSLIDKELATLLERDGDTTLLVQHIDQLGPLKSFINSESVSVLATLVDTLPTTTQTSSHESDCALLADEILKFDRPETHPMTRYREEEDDSTDDDDDQVVIVRSGKSEERKLKRTRRASSEKGASGGTSVKVSKRKPRKSRKSSRSSQFISDWKNYPGQRRSIVREQSALLVTIKECASLQKIREELIKQEGLEEVSYQRWAEAAGVDEAVLKSRLQEGFCCRERLLVTTEWLVKYIARSYRGMGTDFDDLLQVGKMGVLDGAEKFDSQKGCKFSTYVKYWIRKGMLALLAENSGVTLLPARMESIIRKVKEARRAIRHSAGRNPSDSEIATVVGVSVANVRLARKCSRRVVSLYTEIGLEQKANFAEVIPDTSAEAPDEAIFRSQLRERLLQVLDRLPDREGRVLKLRHGLEDGKCRSLEHIGGVYSVSKEWIRKIEKSAVAKLRNDDDVRRELDDFYRF